MTWQEFERGLRSLPMARLARSLTLALLSLAATGCEDAPDRDWRHFCDRPIETPDPNHPLNGYRLSDSDDRVAITPRWSIRTSNLIAIARVDEICNPRALTASGSLPMNVRDFERAPYIYRPVRLTILEVLWARGEWSPEYLSLSHVAEYAGFQVVDRMMVPRFEPGTTGIVFLSRPGHGNWPDSLPGLEVAAGNTSTRSGALEAAYPINWYEIRGSLTVSDVSELDSELELDDLKALIQESVGPE